MAAGDKEIRQTVRMDNQASPELRRVADDTQNLGDATRDSGQQASEAAVGQHDFADAASQAGLSSQQAGEAADGHASDTSRAKTSTENYATAQRDAAEDIGETTEAVGAQTEGMTEQGEGAEALAGMWGGLAAAGGILVAALNEIADAADRANDALLKSGQGVRGLINNLGADRGRAAFQFTRQAAAEESLDVAGLAGLVESGERITDLHPDMSDETFQRQVAGFARLDRVTGLRGRQAVDLVQAFQGRGGMDFDQALEASGEIATGPLEASEARNLLERGGMQGLTLALAAAPHSAQPTRFVRQVPTVLQRLNDMDEEQREAFGLEEGMGLIPSLHTMVRGIDEGRVEESDVVDALGGERVRDVIDPMLLLARHPNRLRNVHAGFYAEGGLDRRMEQLRQDPDFRRAERQNVRDVSGQVHDESMTTLARFGEAVRIVERDVQEMPGLGAVSDVPYVGGMFNRLWALGDPDLWWGDDSEQMRERIIERQRREAQERAAPQRSNEAPTPDAGSRRPQPSPDGPAPDAGSRRREPASDIATAAVSPVGGQAGGLDASTLRDLQATLEGLRTTLATAGIGEVHRTDIRIGTNYAGWRDPAWADIMPVRGMA